ncbi:MAG: COG1470 family protein, partial [Candidatus Poseidoniales archaeon]
VQDWVDFEAPLSKLLSEPGGSQDSHTFSFTITPDDSVEPGTIPVYIQGRAGTSVGCQEIVYVTVGQSKDASISLSTSKISNAEPGTTQRIQVAISNTGNGQDTYAVGTSGLPSGWQVSMSQSSVTIDGK